MAQPFTAPGAAFRNHEWLTQLAFYAIYSVGGMPLLTFAAAILVTLAWALSWLLMAGAAKWRVLLVGVALREMKGVKKVGRGEFRMG